MKELLDLNIFPFQREMYGVTELLYRILPITWTTFYLHIFGNSAKYILINHNGQVENLTILI
jgi:hypothetical protein